MYNTQVREIIKQRLPIATRQGRILFNCPTLEKHFDTASFKLDLRSGHPYTYTTPPVYIGVPCQKEEFDLELLLEKFNNGHDSDEPLMQELELVPLIRKIAAPTDVMDLDEIQYHIGQYCKLWTLYADMSIQLKQASKLPQDKAVANYKIYGSHISDLLKQFDEITKLFAIENELRAIRGRELIPCPTFNPQEERIESKGDKDKLMKEINDELVPVLRKIENIETNYQKEKEAKQKEQARLTRQPNRPELNTSAVSTSTPIRNTNIPAHTGTNQQQLTEAAVTFNPNSVCHL